MLVDSLIFLIKKTKASTRPAETPMIKSNRTVSKRLPPVRMNQCFQPHHIGDFPPLTHVPSHNHQYRRHACQRYVNGKRGEDEQDEEDGDSVDNTGNRRNCAVFNICCGPRNRSRCRYAAESGAAILAMPCPTSSLLLSCRDPFILSATIADNMDSSPPRSAMIKADGNIITMLSIEKSGS